MGLYNFQARFIPFILDGSKCHTIRAPRKGIEDKAGNTMHLYTGLRTKKAKLLGRFECVRVEEIEIAAMGAGLISVWVDGIALGNDEKDMLAWRDGFRNSEPAAGASMFTFRSAFDEMMAFWAGRLPFHGHVFHWKYIAPSPTLTRRHESERDTTEAPQPLRGSS